MVKPTGNLCGNSLPLHQNSSIFGELNISKTGASSSTIGPNLGVKKIWPKRRDNAVEILETVLLHVILVIHRKQHGCVVFNVLYCPLQVTVTAEIVSTSRYHLKFCSLL